MEGFVRKLLFGVAMSLVIGGVAYAEDFIVVRSSDPRIPKNASFSAGERVYLARGRSMTVINSAGSQSTYQGVAGGVVMPAGASADSGILGSLRALLDRPEQRRTFGAMRGGRYGDDSSCPALETLTTPAAIVAADEEGCTGVAKAAAEALIK